MPEQGWQPDPSGRFEERYMVGGRPTDLVRTGGVEQVDPMPLSPPTQAPTGSEVPPAVPPSPGGSQPDDTSSPVVPPVRVPPGSASPPAPGSTAGAGGSASTTSRSRSAWPLVVAVLVLLSLLVVGVVLAGGGDEEAASTSTTSAPRSTTTARPTTTTNRVTTTTAPEHFTRDNYERLATDPDRFEGSTVDVVGRVFGGIERNGDLLAFQMFAKPADSEWNTAVIFRGEPPFPITDGTYVRVQGKVIGDVSGSNLFGGTVTAVAVAATSLEPSDATAAASPALREVAVGESITQHGLTVTLDTVQYAADETRVFVTVTNDSGERASFYDFTAKALRGSTQFDVEYSFNDYPEIPSDIMPGVTASGVVVFGAMDPAPPTRFILEARTMDYRVDFAPYVFDVPGA